MKQSKRINKIVGSMQGEKPQYRIKYIECKEKDHAGQKTNMICLNQSCLDHALICSLCTQDQHYGHEVKPLKFYIEHLYQQYKVKQQETKQKLDHLEQNKAIFLLKLKASVERLAHIYRDLEKDIYDRYEALKQEILENEARRNNFQHFYNSLIKENYSDPKFQIQKYLPKLDVPILQPTNQLQQFTDRFVKEFEQARSTFLLKKAQINPAVVCNPAMMIKPNMLTTIKNDQYSFFKSIIQQGNTFTNKDSFETSMITLNVLLKQLSGKIRVKVVQKPSDNVITIGVISKASLEKNGYIFNKGLKYVHMDSKGEQNGANYNYINAMIVGQQVDMVMKKNHLKLTSKGNVCDFLVGKQQKDTSYIFVALQGQAKVQIEYPL